MHVGAPEAVTLQLRCAPPQLAGPCQPQLGRCKQLRILPGTLWLAGRQYAHCDGRILHRADCFSLGALGTQLGRSTLLDNVHASALGVSDNSVSVIVQESKVL